MHIFVLLYKTNAVIISWDPLLAPSDGVGRFRSIGFVSAYDAQYTDGARRTVQKLPFDAMIPVTSPPNRSARPAQFCV